MEILPFTFRVSKSGIFYINNLIKIHPIGRDNFIENFGRIIDECSSNQIRLMESFNTNMELAGIPYLYDKLYMSLRVRSSEQMRLSNDFVANTPWYYFHEFNSQAFFDIFYESVVSNEEVLSSGLIEMSFVFYPSKANI